MRDQAPEKRHPPKKGCATARAVVAMHSVQPNLSPPGRRGCLAREITSSSGLSVGTVSTVLGPALECGRNESSPPDLEMPQPPDTIDFTRVRKEITQGGRLASQLLRSVR